MVLAKAIGGLVGELFFSTPLNPNEEIPKMNRSYDPEEMEESQIAAQPN